MLNGGGNREALHDLCVWFIHSPHPSLPLGNPSGAAQHLSMWFE